MSLSFDLYGNVGCCERLGRADASSWRRFPLPSPSPAMISGNHNPSNSSELRRVGNSWSQGSGFALPGRNSRLRVVRDRRIRVWPGRGGAASWAWPCPLILKGFCELARIVLRISLKNSAECRPWRSLSISRRNYCVDCWLQITAVVQIQDLALRSLNLGDFFKGLLFALTCLKPELRFVTRSRQP